MGEVQLLTKRGLVLLCLARQPGSTVRTLAQELGVTEGTVRQALRELAEAGYIQRDSGSQHSTSRVNYGRVLDSHPILQQSACGRYPTTGEVLGAFLGPEVQHRLEAEAAASQRNGHGLLGRLMARLRPESWS